MPSSCIEERLSNTLTKNSIYRILFVKYTAWFDLKNLIIKRELKNIIKSKKLDKPRVLDVGFGLGQQIHYVLDMLPRANVLGIDITEKAVTCANKYFNARKFPSVYCMRKNILDFEGNNAFDLVFAFKLLNYVEDDKEAIRRMYDALAPKGKLLVLNTYSADSRKLTFFDNIHSLPMVRKGYTMEELRDMLKDAGFSTVKCRYIYGPTGQTAWKIGIGWPSAVIAKYPFLFALLPLYLLLSSPLVFVLNYYDMHIGHTSGHSIFLKAEK
jgi:SAM-dependent methyltransferase